MSDDPDRRSVLRSAGALSLGAVLADALGDPLGRALPVEPVSGRPRTRAADAEAATVFPQGVASGDPTTDGAVLWTRIAPDAYAPTAPLTLEVTAGEGFERFAAVWRVGTDALAERDYTVKVDLAGHLDPGREYAYRFVYDDVAGPVGRFRTLPRPTATPDSVRFGVLTCQDYLNGYYGAFHHVAEADLDWLVHLGDVIYEWGGTSPHDGRDVALPSGHRVAWGLADFRHLYRTYRADRFMQEALASAALVATWDDHEIVDDRFWDYEADRPAAGENAHPRSDDPEFVTRLFADGIRAWWEYMPVRVRYDPDADSVRDQLRLWRSFRFGDLVELIVTDERLFRSRPDADPTVSLPDGAVESPGSVSLDHTMLGREQRGWFAERLASDDTAWTAWANEVLAMELDTEVRGRQPFSNDDAWDGYEAERRLIARHLRANDVDDFVALTGDMHTALAGYLRESYGGGADPRDRVGVELMTPAVTSRNLAETLRDRDVDVPTPLVEDFLLENNDHIEFLDGSSHGYAVVEFTPDACEYTAYAVDKSVDAADARRRRLAAYRVPAGETTLQRR